MSVGKPCVKRLVNNNKMGENMVRQMVNVCPKNLYLKKKTWMY